MSRKWRIVVGLLGWIAVCGGGWLAARREMGVEEASLADVSNGVVRWVTGQRTELAAESSVLVELPLGTPVLLRESDGSYRQVVMVSENLAEPVRVHSGEVKAKAAAGGAVPVLPSSTRKVLVSVYYEALRQAGDSFELTYYRAPTSLSWVASSLVSPERKEQIVKLIADEWQQQQQETLQSLRPVMQESVQRAIAAIQAELPVAIERHRGQFAQLADKYKSEILQKEMVPLVREHILPIMERETRPLMGELGRSLWNRVSLWSFAWRYFYDASPLPQRNAVQEEFDRFVESEAIPELRSRSDQFVKVLEKVVSEVSKDPVVNATIRKNLRLVAADPELHSLVWIVVKEAVLQNKTLRSSLDEYWNSAEVRQIIQRTSSRFEPSARAIGDLIVGSREDGITPEMARILRLQILMKDRHWLVLNPVVPGVPGVADAADTQSVASGSSVRIVIAKQQMTYPITFDSDVSSPLAPVDGQR